MRYKHNRWSSPNSSLHPRCHFFPHIMALDSATWQEWDYLSERSFKYLPDPSCILGQHQSPCSIPCHKITILLGQKKKPIITKTTTESNFLLSLWIKSRFPSDKTSPREPSPVTQVHLGLAEPTASSWVPPGRHCPSRTHNYSEDIRGSSDRKTLLLLGNPIKCAGSSVGWRGTLKLFSSFLGHAAAVPRRRWGHC